MPKVGKAQMPYQSDPSLVEANQLADENPAVVEANKLGQELKSIPLESTQPEFPVANALDRNETYRMGGMVEEYEKGGKVRTTK